MRLNHQREIEVGLMEKENYDIYKILQDGICEAKDNLAKFNKIDEDQIKRVANDAVYINSDIDLKYLNFVKYFLNAQKKFSQFH